MDLGLNSSNVKTVVFAHPRTGSSNLTYVLNLHPDLNLAMEPFWHGYGAAHPDERNYVDAIVDLPTLAYRPSPAGRWGAALACGPAAVPNCSYR